MQPVMQVPLLDLAAQYAPIRDAVVEAVTRVVDTQKFILGPEVEAFEAEVAAYLGARHAIGVSSGTDALLVAMMALDLGPGDEVIVPTYSFFATAGCVSRTGATPVLVDIDPRELQPRRAAVRRAIRLAPGRSCRCTCTARRPTCGRCRGGPEHGSVIEDAAQAIGATLDGQALGRLGVGCFSFYPSKNLGGGDAGLVTVSDDEMAEGVRMLATSETGMTTPLRRRPRAPTASTTAGPLPAPTMMCSVPGGGCGSSPTSSNSRSSPSTSEQALRQRARGSLPPCSRGGTSPSADRAEGRSG